ncbi:MAG: DUF512 domain-containing protein [Lachnospiraceae bacterium]|nr:DUF512 domain-containing protein [Lachnospiraceae bacterium]
MLSEKHIIKKVHKDSIAMEMGLEPGDEILSVNGDKIIDVFDYQLLMSSDYVEILVKTKQGEESLLEIEKDETEDLGVEFENDLMDRYRSCSNRCIFCFIDQLPSGMRDTLYFKDDDSRLSFLQGNYVTLTNMNDEALQRIIRHRLSPINISVHTTDPELRCRMLGNRNAGRIKDQLQKLYDAGITMNGQIVLCKDINDGDALKRTIEDLSAYIPLMESVSVVPVGITRYRDGLYPLESFQPEDAEVLIDTVEEYQKKLFKDHGTHFIHASDEWYILCGREVPDADTYDDYLQLENGVGMLRLLKDGVEDALSETDRDDVHRSVDIATGRLMYGYMKDLASRITSLFKNTRINVHCIKNRFFGESITVAGLITGQDLIEQLKGRLTGTKLLITSSMLRSGEDVFLDDVTLEEASRALGTEICPVANEGEPLIGAILE